MSRLLRRVLASIGAIIVVLSIVSVAKSDSLRAGIAAYNRENYVKAARIMGPLALNGVAQAQFYLGFMYDTGRGVPQSYAEAAKWWYRAAEQGNAFAQYMLGLLYDKGHGVPLDKIEAHKWLNLAASHAPARMRESWVRLRDAVATKMSLAQLAEARQRATEWRPSPER